ncbi:HSP20 family protein [Desulfotomaculum arcticum]|uniref:HSP20 family protein n=1 Tax=Desulfotruncus arcticus DSM 17038 TaxID=1121424 RepID=A0A1I2VHT0_9FIRM|nr:Hsp20/alpha crystallin family protein [Desulfotruncus arcticus]SFG88742.1 HSP20 family protein [Desulfotomaculum arcticum] [Desulfotruncus arcticus DSM 17038]
MSKKFNSGGLGFGDIFRGLGDLLEVLQKMDAQGVNEINKTGEFGSSQPKGLKGAYGLRVRIGEPGKSTIQTFGNLRAAKDSVEFKEVWEPILDVFDEEDHVLVVAELPGIEEKQLQLEIVDNCLHLVASGIRNYKKSVPLPCAVEDQNIVTVFKNGIVEITLRKKQ